MSNAHPVRDQDLLDEFYSFDIDLMKQIVGEDLHWHCITGEYDLDKPFERAIQDLYRYIEPGSTVLDCGTGWGGPGRMLQRDIGCQVEGVTVSKIGAAYCQQFFPTMIADLNVWKPEKHYRTALFVESYAHMLSQALLNIRDNVDQIVMKDFVHRIPDYQEAYHLDPWHVSFRTIDMLSKDFQQAGFEIKEFEVEYDFWEPSLSFWYHNLIKFDINSLPPQLQLTYGLTMEYQSNPTAFDNFGFCTIHATRIQ